MVCWDQKMMLIHFSDQMIMTLL